MCIRDRSSTACTSSGCDRSCAAGRPRSTASGIVPTRPTVRSPPGLPASGGRCTAPSRSQETLYSIVRYAVPMDEARSNNNVVYRCAFHVVRCPKYRRKVITGPVDVRLKEIIREVRAEKDAPILELETMPDHVHSLVVRDPQYGIHRLVKTIKARSSRLLRQEFPFLRSRIPTLWTNSHLRLRDRQNVVYAAAGAVVIPQCRGEEGFRG